MQASIDISNLYLPYPDWDVKHLDALDLVPYPVNQMVGYIMSGDPTYITSYKNARSLIMKVERDELVEELLKEYIRNKSWQTK